MILGNCTKEPEFWEVFEELIKQAPTYNRLLTLAKLAKLKGDMSKYRNFMDKYFESCGNKKDKVEYYLETASGESEKGNKIKARSLALEAINIDAGIVVKVYNFIGFLYFHSGKECVSSDPQKAPIFNYVAYMVAYEMFEKGGNQEMMNKAKQYFPQAIDIHTLLMTEQIGKPIPVGC